MSNSKSFSLKHVSKRALLGSFLVSALGHQVWAVEPFTLRDIRVEGLQRSEAGTVFGSLPFQVGDTYNDEKGAAAIRALFATGLFKDVRLEVEKDVLLVLIEERPLVAEVFFTGTKEFEPDVLKKALKDIGLYEGRPFDKALADKAEQELRRQYLNRSLYGAEVVATVTPLERNRVNVNFTVTEGDVAKITELRIVGAKAFPESELRDQLDLDTGNWMSWYTKSDRYSRAKLNADLETLRAYYLTRGYLEFKIEASQVSISPDKRTISILINITEGQRYAVTGVKLAGDYLGREEDFKSLVKIKVGESYNSQTLEETKKAFADKFGAYGYAFARVDAQAELDRVNGLVSYTLVAEPGRRAYVRRINIAGNERTRDEVIRREFRQYESAWYDADRIRLSRDRVDRLGFFKSVQMQTAEVPGTNDQVDLNLSVEEKPTGNLMIGAGYSSSDKLGLMASVKQENVFGSGNYLGFDINTSTTARTLNLSAVNPYFTADGVSRSFDLYYRTTQPYSTQGGDYKLITPGVGVRFGIPFTEYDTVYLGIASEFLTVVEGTHLPAAYQRYVGERNANLPVTVGWTKDNRDSALAPTQGRLQRLNTELGLGNRDRYSRTNYQFQEYVPLTKKYTLAFNTELGLGKSISGVYPVFKNYYAGGLGSVRGFEQNTLGSTKTIDPLYGSHLGGSKKLVFNLEALAPFPGVGNDRTLRMLAFVDAGNVFADGESIGLGELRASTGFGINWLSPVGPLRLTWGRPLRKKDSDKIQTLQFQIGTAF